MKINRTLNVETQVSNELFFAMLKAGFWLAEQHHYGNHWIDMDTAHNCNVDYDTVVGCEDELHEMINQRFGTGLGLEVVSDTIRPLDPKMDWDFAMDHKTFEEFKNAN